MAGPQEQFIDVDGVRTRVLSAGTQGSPLLLLHGIGCSSLEWDKSLAALAQRHRVYAPDLPAHGSSAALPEGGGDLPALTRFVLRLMATLGLEAAHLGGNSLGGRLALACAMAAPERVRSLLLAAPAGVGRETIINFRLATLPGLGELLTRPSAFGLGLLWRAAYHDARKVEPARLAAKLRDARQPGAQAAFLRTLRSFVGFGGFEPQQLAHLQAGLPRVTQPALIIWGRGDRFLPCAHGQALQQALPAARLSIYDDCGHVPQLEQAERFNAEALAFLAEVDAARA